jgi:hypothetical protein
MAYGTVNADVIQTSTSGGILGAGNASIMKNRIINGAMVIDQRNAGAALTLSSSAQYCPDRYQIRTASGSSNTAQTQTSVVPAGFNNALKITIGTGANPGAGENNFIAQSIEGYNVADLNFGTANAQTFTASFWVRSSITGTYGLSFSNNAGDRAYVTSYTVNSANTWEYKTITVAGDTTGTWDKTNNVGIQICWDIGQGSNRSYAASTSWQSNNALGLTGGVKLVATSGATLYLTSVQLEVGSSATGFEYRQYGQEFALCQRYFQQYGDNATNKNVIPFAQGAGTTEMDGYMTLPVVMRTTPTLTSLNLYASDGTNSLLAMTSGTVYNASTSTFGAYWTVSGGTAYRPYVIRTYTSAGYMQLSAEL